MWFFSEHRPVLNLSWLETRLAGDGPPIIIDGGMGPELQRAGIALDGKVWSARALLSHPEIVREVHESYIRAGAEVIICNSFSSARHMLEPGGLGDQVEKVNTEAVRLAREARDNAADRPVAIAGSICEWAFVDDPSWNDPESVRVSVREQAG